MFYKIGVTSKEDVVSRFKSITYRYEIIKVYSHPDPIFIMDLEKHLLKLSIRYNPFKTFPGSSECVADLNTALEYLSTLGWMTQLKEVLIRPKIKGQFSDVVSKYIQYLIDLERHKHTPLYLAEKALEFKEQVESDNRFDVLVEYVAVFGVDESLLECCKSMRSSCYLNSKVQEHKDRLKLKQALPMIFKVGDVYTTQDLKDKLKETYFLIGLDRTPKTSDLRFAFKLGETSVLVGSKNKRAVKLLKP